MQKQPSESAGSQGINIETSSLDEADEEYQTQKDRGQSLTAKHAQEWQWDPQQQGVLRRSNTQELPTEEEDLMGTDLGCEWANWNINRINIRPAPRLEEAEQLIVPGRLKKRTSRSLEKEVGSPRKLRKQSKVIAETKENDERIRRRAMINRVLAGKGSFLWVFILSSSCNQRDLEPINKLYQGHRDNDYVSPLYRSYQEAVRFLKIQNHFFKIMTDLENARDVVEQSSVNASIMAIYLYSPLREKNSEFFELKRQSRKVKGVFLSLNEAANQVAEDIAQEARFIDIDGNLEKAFKPRYRFPTFMVLSGTDSSEVTAYRLCLYSAIKLQQPKDKAPFLKEFVEMVETRYDEDKRQLGNLQAYKQIDHLSPNTPQKAQKILRFYVQQTFYYATVNCLLRLARTPEEFHPCMLPFNQTYHAIRYFHSLSKKEKRSFKAYRGAKLRQSEVNALAKGCYIEMLGFASSSLSREVALRFMDNDSYLIEIIVDQSSQQLGKQDQLYEHGYVDINKYNLATDAFQSQQEVLFNALNVYEVVQIDMRAAIRTITLKYGAMRTLRQKPTQKVTPKEKALLANLQYCIDKLGKIEDYGDLMLLSSQHDKAQHYYQEKLKEATDDPNIYGKLSHIEMQMGDLKKAEEHALKMLSMLQNNPGIQADQTTTLYQSTESAAELLSAVDSIEDYEGLSDIQLKMAKDYLIRSKVLLNRSTVKLKRGELQGCLDDLILANLQLQSKQQSFEKRRSLIKRSFFFKALCSCYDRETAVEVERQRDAELLSIEQDQINFKAKEEEFYEQKILIEKLKEEYYQRNGSIEKVKESYRKIKDYFKRLTEKDEDIEPVKAAKYYELQAVSYQKKNFSDYQESMETAIDILKQFDSLHPNIANLSESLASERHTRLRCKLSYPEDSDWLNLVTSGEGSKSTRRGYKDRFNYEEHKQYYKKCRYQYKQAIDILIYHKGRQHPECLKVQNKLAELDYDYSLLKLAQARAEDVTQRNIAGNHSEGAKGYLLLGKIALARGELKRAFRMIEQSETILNAVLCKKDNRSYLIKHPLFAEVNITKAKIFNKQSHHELALRQLDLLQKISANLTAPQELLANVFQEKAEVLFCQGETLEFEETMLKAIAKRQHIMGKYNVYNAISYAKLSMYSRLLEDQKDALHYHDAAFELFSKFSADHPNSWIIHLSNASVYQKSKSSEFLVAELNQCLRVAERRYSPDHINLMKIQLQVAKLFAAIQMKREAWKLYQAVGKNLERQLQLSACYEEIVKDSDDEKLLIKKDLKKQVQGAAGSGTVVLDLENYMPFSSYSSNVKTLECILQESKLEELGSNG